MFYIALFLLVLLGLVVLAVVGVNLGPLMNGVSLNFFVGHLSVPVLVFFLLGIFLGGLLLYVVSTFAARRDVREIKRLRARIDELEEAQAQAQASSSGPLAANFVPPVVPMPGFSQTGPLSSGQQQSPSNSLPQGQQPSNSLPPRQPAPPGSLLNLPPSSSGISSLPLSARQGSPSQSQQSSGLRPPFFNNNGL